jgi:hypothetical protein
MTQLAATHDLVRILVITTSDEAIEKIVRCATWRALTSLKCAICIKNAQIAQSRGLDATLYIYLLFLEYLSRFGHMVPSFQTIQLGAALGITRLSIMFGYLQHPMNMAAEISEQTVQRQVDRCLIYK